VKKNVLLFDACSVNLKGSSPCPLVFHLALQSRSEQQWSEAKRPNLTKDNLTLAKPIAAYL